MWLQLNDNLFFKRCLHLIISYIELLLKYQTNFDNYLTSLEIKYKWFSKI